MTEHLPATASVADCRCPDGTHSEHRLSSWHNTGGPPCWGRGGVVGHSFITICACHSPVDERPVAGVGFEIVCRRSGTVIDEQPGRPRVVQGADGTLRVEHPDAGR